MTPVGHALTGFWITVNQDRKVKYAAIIGAILPDCDFVLFWHESFNQIHRAFTHSFFFILVGLGVFQLICYMKTNEWQKKLGVFFLFGGGLHLIIDSCLDNNPSNGDGVPFFFPISKEFYSLFSFYDFLNLPKSSWNNPQDMLFNALPLILLEGILLVIVAIKYRNITK